jgi:hypothetical protein
MAQQREVFALGRGVRRRPPGGRLRWSGTLKMLDLNELYEVTAKHLSESIS